MAHDMAVFDSEAEASDAYFGDDGETGGDDGAGEPDSGAGWNEPEFVDLLEGDWSLLVQQQTDGDRTRYFVIGGPEGNHAITAGGGTETFESDDTFNDLPAFETEDEAREAHALWLEEHGAEAEWTEWEVVEEADPWYVYRREQIEGDATEFVIAGMTDGDDVVYLAPGAEITDEPHIYDDMDAVMSALVAYFEAEEAGEIDPEESPNGERPPVDMIEEDTADDGGPGDLLATAVDTLTHPIVMGVIVLIVLVAIYRRQGGNL